MNRQGFLFSNFLEGSLGANRLVFARVNSDMVSCLDNFSKFYILHKEFFDKIIAKDDSFKNISLYNLSENIILFDSVDNLYTGYIVFLDTVSFIEHSLRSANILKNENIQLVDNLSNNIKHSDIDAVSVIDGIKKYNLKENSDLIFFEDDIIKIANANLTDIVDFGDKNTKTIRKINSDAVLGTDNLLKYIELHKVDKFISVDNILKMISILEKDDITADDVYNYSKFLNIVFTELINLVTTIKKDSSVNIEDNITVHDDIFAIIADIIIELISMMVTKLIKNIEIVDEIVLSSNIIKHYDIIKDIDEVILEFDSNIIKHYDINVKKIRSSIVMQ